MLDFPMLAETLPPWVDPATAKDTMYQYVSMTTKFLMLVNALLVVWGWLMIKGAWYKFGVNYLLDNERGTRHGGSNLFVAWCLNILLWICSGVFWYAYSLS